VQEHIECPRVEIVAGFYARLEDDDEQRLHALGVNTQCSDEFCRNTGCPFHPINTPKP